MKPFAKAFYNSPAWQACRAAYISQRRQIDGGQQMRQVRKEGAE